MKFFSSSSLFFFLTIFLCSGLRYALGYVSPEIRKRWADGYTLNQALETIDRATKKGKDIQDLYCAVKFADRFANDLYRDSKEELMQKINGTWELRLALNSDRDVNFYPHPEFRAFAMAFSVVSDEYFGKGIAPDSTFCFVALGGPSSRNIQRRQVFMTYEDYYINGREVPGWDLSYYLRGYAKQWTGGDNKKELLAFTVIACTDYSLVVRGSKTGGIAIFRRRPEDFAPSAFGFPLAPS